MKPIAILAVVVMTITGGTYFWLGYQGGNSEVDDGQISVYPLIVNLVAPVKTKLEKTAAGNPVGYNPIMVSVTVTLKFTSEEAMKRARGEMKQLRRAYGNKIGKYLTHREKTATDNIASTIRAHVAETTDKLLGAGTVIGFDVLGQFENFTAK